ncbi:MAG TPA: aminotransferase class V-fold PLP-dependent enzyme [Candidatus Acidoferrales bacterium]|nr:aminotransferase class V-fold PLP-dependent enzyme [Candidatus Acidoferrales bacterium]
MDRVEIQRTEFPATLVKMRELLNDAAFRAARYLEEIQERRVGPSADAVRGLDALIEPFPCHPTAPGDVLALLDRYGSPATMGISGPRFFGWVIGGSLPAALAANWLASAWDQNAGLFVATPISALLEEVTLGWLTEVLGLPAGCGGAFVTGATVANFTALAAARHAVLARAGWDVEAQGLFGAPRIQVVVGDEAHPSLIKSLGMLGLGRERVVRVPVDGQGRMRADLLPKLEAPAIVCVQAGNVNTGAFDPAEEICGRAHEMGAWVHVDGAFGLWAAASPRYAHLAGTGDADSWATDAHKWLNVPYDCGLAFVRDPEILRGAMSLTAAYLPQGEHREPSQYVPELSRRARGVDIWAAMKSLGRSGLAELVERCCGCARRFAEGLSAAGFEVLNDVVLNQVLVSFGDAATTGRVIAGIQEDGTCWCGGTVWQGRTAMRISVSSWATTEADVDRSLAAMLRVARTSAGAPTYTTQPGR